MLRFTALDHWHDFKIDLKTAETASSTQKVLYAHNFKELEA